MKPVCVEHINTSNISVSTTKKINDGENGEQWRSNSLYTFCVICLISLVFFLINALLRNPHRIRTKKYSKFSFRIVRIQYSNIPKRTCNERFRSSIWFWDYNQKWLRNMSMVICVFFILKFNFMHKFNTTNNLYCTDLEKKFSRLSYFVVYYIYQSPTDRSSHRSKHFE